MLVLDAGEEVVFAEGDIHLVGDDGILCLGEVAEGVDITCYRPRGIVSLSVAHHKLDDRSGIVIFGGARLVLERVGATQRVMELAEGAVQLRSERSELILGIIAAAEG